MKRQLLLAALCCAATGATFAQVNSPDAGGYLERGILMFDDRNYEGCIDQLTRIHNLSPTPERTRFAGPRR